jgi:hypothetical protein
VRAAPEQVTPVRGFAGPIGRLAGLLDHAAILPGMAIAGVVFVAFQVMTVQSGFPFAVYDAHSYWLAGGSDHPYAGTIASGFDDTVNLYKYRYPPPLAQVFALIHLIRWPIAAGLWIGLLFAVLLVLAGRWAPLALVFPPTLYELYLGNVNLLIALAIVLGFRRPATWAFVLLTKATPGIALLWFAFRREWRPLMVALGATAVVAAVSFVLAPQLWSEFRDAMTVQAGAALDVPPLAIQVPLPIRLAVAVLVVWFAARSDRAWLVAVAATIAAPAIWGNVLVILVAAIPLAEGRGIDRPLLWLPRRRVAE